MTRETWYILRRRELLALLSAIILAAAVALAILCCTGCNAGTSADLLTYDAIEAASGEVRKGMDAYDTAVKADANAVRENIRRDLKASILIAGGDANMATRIVAAMDLHIGNILEKERRRGELYRGIADSLDYIDTLCSQGRDFVIFRADVNTQWKQYLQSQARTALAKKEK